MELCRGYVFAPRSRERLKECLVENIGTAQIVILCLGTDKLVGDCLAPLVAENLRKNDFPCYIYGGLHAPITAQNCEFAFDFVRTVHKDAKIILSDSMATKEQARLGDIVVSQEYFGAINSLNIKPDLCIYGVTSLLKNGMLNCARLFIVEQISALISGALLDFYKTQIKLKNTQ